jgi:hypothetical protein
MVVTNWKLTGHRALTCPSQEIPDEKKKKTQNQKKIPNKTEARSIHARIQHMPVLTEAWECLCSNVILEPHSSHRTQRSTRDYGWTVLGTLRRRATVESCCQRHSSRMHHAANPWSSLLLAIQSSDFIAIGAGWNS